MSFCSQGSGGLHNAPVCRPGGSGWADPPGCRLPAELGRPPLDADPLQGWADPSRVGQTPWGWADTLGIGQTPGELGRPPWGLGRSTWSWADPLDADPSRVGQTSRQYGRQVGCTHPEIKCIAYSNSVALRSK